MTREFTSFAALASHFERTAARLPATKQRALEEVGERVEVRAQQKIGVESSGWPALAESTIAEKARLGYPTPAPLLRTGELRASIAHEVDGDVEVAIGSPEETALWQELGTSRGIPPRSFLGASMIETREPNARSVLKAAIRAFRGR